jgi:hypothetical protein
MRSAENLSAKRLNIISRAIAGALMGVKWIRHGAQRRGKIPFAKCRREISTKKNPSALNAFAFEQMGFFTLLYN